MTLVAIGGAEDKKGDMAVWQRLLSESGVDNPHVHVVTTASEFPDDMRRIYQDAFAVLGFSNYRISHIDSRDAANDPALAAWVADTDIVFFSGGNQSRLTAFLDDTAFMDAIRAAKDAGRLVVSGTSAGAASASAVMICGGDPETALTKGAVPMAQGLGFTDSVIFDTHFSQRNRLSRLFNAVSVHPSCVGVGLDEDTGIVMKGQSFEVIGSNAVVIVDGENMVPQDPADATIRTDGAVVHTLHSGDRYDIASRRVIRKQI